MICKSDRNGLDAAVWLHPPQHRDGSVIVGDVRQILVSYGRLPSARQSLSGQHCFTCWLFWCRM